MSVTKQCKDCKRELPATKDYFGHTPNGNLRNQCRDCKKLYEKKYGKAHKDEQANRGEIRSERGGHLQLTQQEKWTLFTKQKGLCLCCGEKINKTDETEVDHLIPIAQGGANSIANLNLAHKQCNKEKHAKTLAEHWQWRKQRGLSVSNHSVLQEILGLSIA